MLGTKIGSLVDSHLEVRRIVEIATGFFLQTMDQKGFEHLRLSERGKVAVEIHSQLLDSVAATPHFDKGVGEFLVVADGGTVGEHNWVNKLGNL